MKYIILQNSKNKDYNNNNHTIHNNEYETLIK